MRRGVGVQDRVSGGLGWAALARGLGAPPRIAVVVVVVAYSVARYASLQAGSGGRGWSPIRAWYTYLAVAPYLVSVIGRRTVCRCVVLDTFLPL